MVKANVRGLGKEFSAYLEETGLGNDPRALIALANLGDYLKTPGEARRELDRLMASKDYTSQDKGKRALVIARVQALSRVANRAVASPEEPLNAIARGQKQTKFVSPRATNEASATAAAAAIAATAATNARTELGKMMSDRKGDLMNSGAPGHKAAVEKYMSLLKQIS
jgi:hypothetical protein